MTASQNDPEAAARRPDGFVQGSVIFPDGFDLTAPTHGGLDIDPPAPPRPRGEGHPRKVNLTEAFATFNDCWNPKVAGQVNESLVKLVKLSGAFHWHHHDEEDELFLVVAGRLRMGLRDGSVDLAPGEFIIVPRGVEHCPEALGDECHVLLLEPKTTLNTGNIENERTVRDLDRLSG